MGAIYGWSIAKFDPKSLDAIDRGTTFDYAGSLKEFMPAIFNSLEREGRQCSLPHAPFDSLRMMLRAFNKWGYRKDFLSDFLNIDSDEMTG